MVEPMVWVQALIASGNCSDKVGVASDTGLFNSGGTSSGYLKTGSSRGDTQGMSSGFNHVSTFQGSCTIGYRSGSETFSCTPAWYMSGTKTKSGKPLFVLVALIYQAGVCKRKFVLVALIYQAGGG